VEWDCHLPADCPPCPGSPALASACAIAGAAVFGSAATWVYLRAHANHLTRVVQQFEVPCEDAAAARERREAPACAEPRDESATGDSLAPARPAQSDDSGEVESTSTAGCYALCPGSPPFTPAAEASSSSSAPIESGDPCGESRLRPALWRDALVETLQKAEYSGEREAGSPADLLMEIATDAPQRWSMTDFHFVTHCISLVHILEVQGDTRAQSVCSFISRLQQHMAEHMHLCHQNTQLAYRAREDKRRNNTFRYKERQVLALQCKPVFCASTAAVSIATFSRFMISRSLHH
jgi:hypothetical protein